MGLAYDSEQLLSSASASAQPEVSSASGNRRHAFGCITTGGSWTFQAQWSPDGSTWIDVGDLLTLNSASETVVIEGEYPALRLNATRTGGTASAWVIKSWGAPERT